MEPVSPTISVLIFMSLAIAMASNEFALNQRVQSPTDDAYENTAGMVIDRVPFIQHQSGSAGAYRMSLNVPRGAKIVHAYFIMQYNWSQGGVGQMQITLENTADSKPISKTLKNISQRKYLAGRKYLAKGYQYGDSMISTDISELLQIIVSKPDWKRGNYVLVKVINTNNRSTIESISYEARYPMNEQRSARLFIRYTYDREENQIQQSQTNLIREIEPQVTPIEKIQIKSIPLDQSCINPPPAAKKPVIFVIDDLQALWLQVVSLIVTEVHIYTEVDVLLNVIPFKMNQSELLKQSLQFWSKDYPCLIQIGQHGFKHQGNQYRMDTLGYNEQKFIINSGYQIFNEYGFYPKSFTPPAGRQNILTFKLLEQFGMHTSVDWYQYEGDTSGILLLKNIFLCENSDGSILGASCRLKKSQALMSQIDSQISKLGYSCVSLHIQDFITDEGVLDNLKIQTYMNLLNDLKQSDKYEFILPEELYQRKNAA